MTLPVVVETDENVAEDTSFASEKRQPWEELVTPVPWHSVVEAWAELAKSKGLNYETGYLLSLLDQLTDASLLSLRRDPPDGEYIWPSSAAQLVYAYQPSVTVAALEAVSRKLQPVTRLAKELAPVLRPLNPITKVF